MAGKRAARRAEVELLGDRSEGLVGLLCTRSVLVRAGYMGPDGRGCGAPGWGVDGRAAVGEKDGWWLFSCALAAAWVGRGWLVGNALACARVSRAGVGLVALGQRCWSNNLFKVTLPILQIG